MRIAIGSDHAGYELKERMKEHLVSKGWDVLDVGTHSHDSVDYPEFAHQVATEVATKGADLGIVICGSGNGVNISANKHKNIRSALAWSPAVAELARQHNDANVLALPARFIDHEEGIRIVEAFLATTFDGGRHQRRIDKIEVSQAAR